RHGARDGRDPPHLGATGQAAGDGPRSAGCARCRRPVAASDSAPSAALVGRSPTGSARRSARGRRRTRPSGSAGCPRARVDVAGVAYARCDFDRCNRLLDEVAGITDFRADLYRMWMTELRGDTRGALAMMVNPERGGGAPTAVSQTHGAAAGVLYRAGNVD